MSSYCTRCGVELPDDDATHRCLAPRGSFAPPSQGNEQQAGSWQPPAILEQPSTGAGFHTPVPSGPNYVTVDAAHLASRARRRNRLLVGTAIGAVVLLGGGVALWQLTSEETTGANDRPSELDDDDTSLTTITVGQPPTTVAVTSTVVATTAVVGTVAPTTVPVTTAAPTTTAPADTTVPPPQVNPMGDTIGGPPGQSPAGQLAFAVQSGGVTTADAVVLHSDAYYYAVWSRLTGRSRPDGRALASAAGYTVDLDSATVELSGFDPATGPIQTLMENGASIDDAVRSFDLCGPVDCPGLSVNPFVPDVFASGAKLFALAKVTLDPLSDTYLMYVQFDGFVAATASGDNATVVPDPNGTNILAVTYSKNPPAGTQLTLSVTSADGRAVAFTFGID